MARWSHSSMKWAPFEGRLAEKDAVVGHDPDRVAVDVGEAGHQRRAVLGLELEEAAAVDDPGDHLAHVVGGAGVGGDHPVQLAGIDDRLVGRDDRPGRLGPAGPSVATMARTMARAWRSSAARWSVTPDRRACSSPPPSSSAVTTSPVAAFTSGGPPRKMVPWLATMTASSLMAGT